MESIPIEYFPLLLTPLTPGASDQNLCTTACFAFAQAAVMACAQTSGGFLYSLLSAAMTPRMKAKRCSLQKTEVKKQ